MHCLGAVSGGSTSPQRAGNCGSVLGMVRALGVLVSEGRVQGPPRGYMEGPHCAAPLQPVTNNHVCEKDNYLCDRYVILVREITDRVTTYSYLCVEVLLCTDCPCGLAKATYKDPVLPIPYISMTPWQQSSEMLLEYWCISVVPSKGPEMMNNQSLYQAVRSRLHFSQVAAWWSRSKGAAPSYITTRIVSFSEDNLRKFRETPSEHTFPLAACGDGNSIKVTVWALPRVEDVPVLTCSIHPTAEKEEEGTARALTPTKNISAPVTTSNPEALVLPTLVDDRLQTPCNEPGKHHCRCEDEDGSPPSPSLKTNTERKRRRSLPRGPDFISNASAHNSVNSTSGLPSVCELLTEEPEIRIYSNSGLDDVDLNYNNTRYLENRSSRTANNNADCRIHQSRSMGTGFSSDKQVSKVSNHLDNQMQRSGCDNRIAISGETLTSWLSIEEPESNAEKRYKCSVGLPMDIDTCKSPCDSKILSLRREKSPKFNKKDYLIRWGKCVENFESEQMLLKKIENEKSLKSSSSSVTDHHNAMGNINWTTSTISGKETECGQNRKEMSPLDALDTLPIIHRKANFVVNPFSQSSPFHKSNPGPSSYSHDNQSKLGTPFTTYSSDQAFLSQLAGDKELMDGSLVRNVRSENPQKGTIDQQASVSNNDLVQLMSNLKCSEEMEKMKDSSGIFDWISKVPSRVLNVATNNGLTNYKSKINEVPTEECKNTNEVKSKLNSNLELSQWEFDEVLAVLRARTPAGRRRTPVRTIKRRDKVENQSDDAIFEQQSYLEKTQADINLLRYPIYNNVCRAVAADELRNFKPHIVGTNRSAAVHQEKRANVKKILHPRELVQPECVRRSSQIYDEKLKSEVTDERKHYHGKHEKVDAKPVECFYNVTNKADVLLGAILRTSNDSRKVISDISNGARPRTVFSAQNCDSRSDVHIANDKIQKGVDVKSYKDEGSLPLSLNKQISLFKQLFSKEQTKQNSETLSSQSYYDNYAISSDQSLNNPQFHPLREFNLQPKKSKGNKVKRRIDFSNPSELAHGSDKQNESLEVGNTACLSTNSLYQNPPCPGTNTELQNNFPDLTKKQSLTLLEEEKTGGRDGYISHNPIKHSTNLRLQIGCEGIQFRMQNNSLGHAGTDKKCSSDTVRNDYSQKHISPEQMNCYAIAMQQYQSHADMENTDTSDKGVPSAIEQERFRRSLGNAASMVFHSRTGLPLTSSPAPLRRGSCCFDYDSSLNSVSSKRSALFELNTPPSPGAVSLEEGDREAENTLEGEEISKRRTTTRGLPHSHALLGSFEESALNGRLEPVSTVHGFTAELGASGSFCPKHRKLPVTVFFYTLGDNDKVSTPYLAHINLGKKGYQVPRSGTIQVTLLNPLGTVVKMFVVMYDLSDMPSRSHTFLRQRTLRDKTLRYLIHLRFMSGKSGRIYLHTDIRMIICRKSDVDTASDFGAEPPKELRSFVHGPTNPKFSPRC
ncbi:uncharacterized protein atos isoform X1 [Neodiprion pinetum]|uniref:uncharacterized protein atos isoform X1 n=2 Tax=Neodiprion pinetum TaxID=441929 RepID=UPI001EDEAFBB|nr:protein FAM214A isoform X1 [Neodiprion pinetum]